MRLISCLAIVCLSVLHSFGQAPFIRSHGGDGYDFGAEVIPLTSNSFLVAGTTSSFDDDMSSQMFIYEVDSFGIEQWRKTFGDRFADVARSMVQDIDGNFLLAGYSETIESSYQFSAIKFQPNGDTIWTRYYGGADWDFCHQAVALTDGGFALFGQTFSADAGNGDFYLIRIDANGDTLWTRSYGGVQEEIGESISVANDGGFFLVGTTQSYGAGKKDMYVVRTDAAGDTIWTQTFGGPEDDLCFAVAATNDGGYVLGGGTYNNTPEESDMILRKEGGSQQWTRFEGQAKQGDDFVTDVFVEPNTGKVVAVGQIAEGTFGGNDGRILRYNANGVWDGVAKTHGSQGEENFVDVKLTEDGGYIAVGTTDGYTGRFDDVWLVKTDASGLSGVFSNVDEVPVAEEEMIAASFAPNPIFSETTFVIAGFETAKKRYGGEFRLLLHNVYGQLILNESIARSNQVLDLTEIASGVYVFQLLADNEVISSGKVMKTAY